MFKTYTERGGMREQKRVSSCKKKNSRGIKGENK
jgi:hypothetical protein